MTDALGDQERIQGTAGQALRRLVAQTSTDRRDAAGRAEQFLLFKLWAANHAREEILRTIQGGVTSLRYVPESLQDSSRVGPIRAEDRDLVALNRLHLWTDVYLLELESVADALAQLVNVVFDLGLSVDDKSILNNVDAKLRSRLERHGAAGSSGLEKWRNERPSWLDDLQELRNQATHRHLVRLGEIKPWDQRPPTPGPGKWTSDFVVDIRTGDSRPLIKFVVFTYDETLSLLRKSLQRLLEVQETLATQAGADG